MIVKPFFLTILVGILCMTSYAQDSNLDDGDGIPKVFILGSYQESYAALSDKHSLPLLTVCNDDMNVAYQKWIHMMSAMEVYSDKIDFDLKGLKIWIQIYWNVDGTIGHMAYFLKPNSRNMEYEDLSAFFKGFADGYQMPISTSQGYSHYGSASFPIFAQPIKR